MLLRLRINWIQKAFLSWPEKENVNISHNLDNNKTTTSSYIREFDTNSVTKEYSKRALEEQYGH